MENLIFSPSILVPILLVALILLVLIAIIALSVKRRAERKARRRSKKEDIEKIKKLAAAISQVGLRGEQMREEELLKKDEKREGVKKSIEANKESGDKTVYDDRKKLSDWQVHLSKTYKDMKKKNPKTTFQAAMKAAKKTYKKSAKKAKK